MIDWTKYDVDDVFYRIMDFILFGDEDIFEDEQHNEDDNMTKSERDE